MNDELHDERACAEQHGDCACIPMDEPEPVDAAGLVRAYAQADPRESAVCLHCPWHLQGTNLQPEAARHVAENRHAVEFNAHTRITYGPTR